MLSRVSQHSLQMPSNVCLVPRPLPNTRLITAATMDRCPAEIWSYIFSYACRDGGSTGCSLSLTSKYIREVSIPVRFTSVAIFGVIKISSFYRLLKRGETGSITYLFISDDDPSGNNASSTLGASPPGGPEPATVMISDILRSNAATLLSLSITLSSLSLQLLPPVDFPLIADVTLVASGRKETASSVQPLPVILPGFPRLRRLRLVNIDDGDISDKLFSTSPSITHLHITGHRLAPPLDKLSPTIQSILLQPVSSLVDIDPQSYLRWLRNIMGLMGDTSFWTRITLLRAQAFHASRCSHEARVAWERTKKGDHALWRSGESASVGELLAQLLQAEERFLP